MQVQNCTKHSPARQGEECPKCQIDHLRAVNADLVEALHIISRSTMDPFICGTALEAIRKHRG